MMTAAALAMAASGLQPVHYLVAEKNRHHGEAIAQGFGARAVPPRGGALPERGVLHLVGGLQHGSLEILQHLRATRQPYVFFDRAYFGGGPGSDMLRATLNAYQKNWVQDFGHNLRPRRRLHELGVELKPWAEGGRTVLVVPPSPAICRLFNLGDWEAYTLARLRLCVEQHGLDLDLRVSYKGDPVPLSRRLDDCWAVVTWSSNVAVEAICAGVPAFVGPESAALPVATPLAELERRLAAPLMPAREAWLASLAWGQFTLDEIRRGFAREVLGV